MKNPKWLYLLVITLTLTCLTFITLPILNVFISLDPENFKNTLKDGEVWKAIFTSLKGATFATIVGLIMGVPTSYFLFQTESKYSELVESVINLPIVIPHVAVGITLLELLNSNSPLGKFFSRLGISFVDTIYGIIIAMCFVSISYTITSSLMGFRSINKELIWTARSLGASPYQVVKFIILPLAFPYILRGAILSFARSISEVGAILIIAYYPITAPVLMYERFEDYGLKSSTPIAVLVICISLIIFIILLSISYRREKRIA